MHETAEEMVLRPVTNDTAGKAVVDARNQEESEANEVLKQLEKLDVSSTEEAVAPTHPHPSTAGSPVAQWALGPFASLVDRTRDAISSAGS
ncbi:MAG: Hemerythrin cation binding domain protein [Marmoricola sp.]|nr:Hemerythrin cation binding domain protein [Marmoricola sp.]